jgi:acyl dehydratase
MSTAFETSDFVMEPKLVALFAEHFDGNPVHGPGASNEILPPNTAPGLCVMALSSKALLQLPAFKEILCARKAKVHFMKPVFQGDTLKLKGTYQDVPHRSRPGVIYRTNQCVIINVVNQEVVAEYELTQLLREKPRASA